MRIVQNERRTVFSVCCVVNNYIVPQSCAQLESIKYWLYRFNALIFPWNKNVNFATLTFLYLSPADFRDALCVAEGAIARPAENAQIHVCTNKCDDSFYIRRIEDDQMSFFFL